MGLNWNGYNQSCEFVCLPTGVEIGNNDSYSILGRHCIHALCWFHSRRSDDCHFILNKNWDGILSCQLVGTEDSCSNFHSKPNISPDKHALDVFACLWLIQYVTVDNCVKGVRLKKRMVGEACVTILLGIIFSIDSICFSEGICRTLVDLVMIVFGLVSASAWIFLFLEELYNFDIFLISYLKSHMLERRLNSQIVLWRFYVSRTEFF